MTDFNRGDVTFVWTTCNQWSNPISGYGFMGCFRDEPFEVVVIVDPATIGYHEWIMVFSVWGAGWVRKECLVDFELE